MRTRFAKMVVLPSLALAMLMAVAPATHAQEYLSREAAYFHRHHAAPPLAYDTQANPNYGFGPLRPVGPNDVVSGNRIIGRDPDPFSSCATTIRVGRTEFHERYRVPGLRAMKTFQRSWS